MIPGNTSRHAFSLVEILLVVSIMTTLAGIAFFAFGPARENARKSTCVSNLHQIGRAISMYSADYDGVDAAVGVRSHASELGIPVGPYAFWAFEQQYLKDKRIEFCPSYHDVIPINKRGSTYYWIAFESNPGLADTYARVVSQRGSDAALVACNQHNERLDVRFMPRWEDMQIVSLRLNQQVTVRRISVRTGSSVEW